MLLNNKLFSNKNRPIHWSSYATEKLLRVAQVPNLRAVPATRQVAYTDPATPFSIRNAMSEYQAMMDIMRDSPVNPVPAACPTDPDERNRHLKGFSYFYDASLAGICANVQDCLLETPFRNPDIDRMAQDLSSRVVTSMTAGLQPIIADLKEGAQTPLGGIETHTHALVILYEYPRDPKTDEPGMDWIDGAQAARAGLRAAETAMVIANYLRVLGHSARAHTVSTSEVDLNRLAVSAGIAVLEDGRLHAPFIGPGFGLAAVTTSFHITPDQPLAPLADQPAKARRYRPAYTDRRFMDGPHPFETLKRVDEPTTLVDAPRIPRVPKRTDMFSRAVFGDMGPAVQAGAKDGRYVHATAPSMAQRRALGAFMLLQDGPAAATVAENTADPARNAELVKATAYFLGADAVGLSACPEWVWYSHDATGKPITPPHDQAISIIIDQGYETMEGASGDDWISVAQSMRAYLRFSLLGGVIARQIRALGYPAKAHTVVDGDILQPPLLLLSGLGEVSRIGEAIVNPYLGPRLKSGVVTTTLPIAHDKPVDFGMQNFCEHCNKCARECPSGAITAGPKKMFNGYEIWKSDSQKCATYRVTNKNGAMCGRCMKTCPWNLEGLFSDSVFRWTAAHVPQAAGLMARVDDWLNHGSLNPNKKWWWDLEQDVTDGGYKAPRFPVNARSLQKDLKLSFEDQTLAVYPAPLAPHPWPYPDPMDREAGIAAHETLLTPDAYRARLTKGDTETLTPPYKIPETSPVIPAVITKVERMTTDITKYEFAAADGSPLPEWTAGAHIDVLVSPEYLRQYSLSGNPADRSVYQIAVLCEHEGRGGSRLMHRIFEQGRPVFISKPINHFELDETATKSFLMGGGIGITPMIAMGHHLHAQGRDFEMHYSVTRRDQLAFEADFKALPWADRITMHISEEGSRADMAQTFAGYQPGWHVYTCGADRYMTAVLDAAEQAGFPDEARHLEYFSAPETPEYENHPFTVRLARSGQDIQIPEDKTIADVLIDNGVHVDLKCSDGICGVCQCGVLSGEVEHRDHVLSAKQRETAIILCQSRAKDPDGVLELDL